MFQEYEPSPLSKSILGCDEATSNSPVVLIFPAKVAFWDELIVSAVASLVLMTIELVLWS